MNGQVTVLIATYSGASHLVEQLESLFMQTQVPHRILVHDDGSEDETVFIVRQYVQQYPEKIEILEDGKCFGSASQNFGHLLQHCDTDYIMFCDQDDVWLPEKIEKSKWKMEMLERRHPEMPLLVHTDLEVTDENLGVIDDSFWHYSGLDPTRDSFNRLLMQNVVTGCTVMINRALAQKALPIPDDAIMHDWWLALVAARFGKIGRVDEASMLYRQHAGNNIGAKRFGGRAFWRNALSHLLGAEFKRRLERNQRQAAAFLYRFGAELTEEEVKMLERLSVINTLPFWQRQKFILGYGLYKQGLVRNIALMAGV